MKILYFFLFSFLFIACNTPVINKNDDVAEVNGEQILLSELASQSKQEIFDILNTAYEIKSRVLAGLIKQKLLEDAAKKENMSLEEFIDWFVQQKICVGQDSLKKRYGFIYVDMDDKGNGTLKRTKKKSFNWMKHIIETNGKALDEKN